MAENNHIQAKPEVLKWAREALAMSKNRAAEHLKISVNHLEKLEDGSLRPTLEELTGMSKKYKRTIATLLLNKPPYEKPLPKDCRTINSSKIGIFNEKTILAVRKARALTQSLFELRQELNEIAPKFIWQATLEDDPAIIGQKFRERLNISEIQSINNEQQFLDACIEKLEGLGVTIFQLSLTQDGLRGFSLIDEAFPVIIVKRGSEKISAKIFTLFHEFGHILLNDAGLCNITLGQNELPMEKWCNAFTAEILVPTTELLQQNIVRDYERNRLTEWKQKDLIELSNIFHVGHLVILRRLLTLDRTTAEYYQEKHEKWNKPPFIKNKNPKGRNVPKEIIKEKGRNYISLVFKALDLNKIDLKDTADYLGLKLSNIPQIRQLLSTWI